MIRRLACLPILVLLAGLPAASHAYTVATSPVPVGQVSSFMRAAPAASFADRQGPGDDMTAAAADKAGSIPAPAAVPARESFMRPLVLPASRMAVAGAGGGLAPQGIASSSRLSEVRSEMRARTGELLEEFNAREVEGKIIVSLPGDVLFDFDKSEIRDDAEPVLERLSELLAAFEAAPVIIQGHTDAMGSDAYNLALSDRRAESVRAWLRDDGIAVARMTTEGHGEARPVAPNTRPDGGDDPEGRQRNRRVEFVILGSQ